MNIIESLRVGIEYVPLVWTVGIIGLTVWACEEITGNQYGPCPTGREIATVRKRIFLIGTLTHAVSLSMVWYVLTSGFEATNLKHAIPAFSFLLVTWISKKSLL